MTIQEKYSRSRDFVSMIQKNQWTCLAGMALNTGSFKAVVNFRVEAGDHVPKDHLQSCSSRSSHLSKRTQNELPTCMDDAIRESIIKDVKTSQYYSADEVSDVSGWERLGVMLWHVKSNKAENFAAYRNCSSVTGEAVC